MNPYRPFSLLHTSHSRSPPITAILTMTMYLHMENRWNDGAHRYVRWTDDSRTVIRLVKDRLREQLVLSPRCGHLRGNGGVKAAVRYARVLANHYAYVARFDIRHYYESIDHRVMLAQLNDAGVGPDVFAVVQDYLCVPDRRQTGKGMVAGGAISPLLGGL
jgi:RNA-directed DNA polymerase